MNTLTTVAIVLLTCTISMLGYVLCLEDTTLGGYLPFAFMTATPVASFLLGKAA